MPVDIYPAFTASGVKVTSAVGDGPVGVQFDWPDGHTAFTALPEQGMYLDACDHLDSPIAICAGHDTDHAYLVWPGGYRPLGKTHGIRPCAINVVDGWQLRWMYVEAGGQTYHDTGENGRPLPADKIGTSQGILALETSGRINWADPPDRIEQGLYHKVNSGGDAVAGLLAQQDQLTVLHGGTPHTLVNGLVHNIRIVDRVDGLYGVCARNGGSPVFAVGPPWPDFIDPADQLPPLSDVPLLNRRFGLVCYTFNDYQGLGNIDLPIRPRLPIGQTSVIATLDDVSGVHDDDLWAVYSGESQEVSSEQAIAQARAVGEQRKRGLAIYQDSYPMRESVLTLAEAGDILTPQVFRNQGESIDSYRNRLRSAFRDCSLTCETYPTINIHQRYNGETPTLSVKDVCEGFVAATQIAAEQGWTGMVLFRVGTRDMPAEVIPYIDRFLSGITGAPDARVLPDEPQEPDQPEPQEPELMNVYRYQTGQPDKADGLIPYYIGSKDLLGKRVPSPRSDVAARGGFGILKPNGKWASLNPDGGWEERDGIPENLRTWETFFDANPGMSAPREKSPGVWESYQFNTRMAE